MKCLGASWSAKHLEKCILMLMAHSLMLPVLRIFSELSVFLFLCSKDYKENGGMTLSERGSVLVFLPGIMEIRYMQEALSKLVHKRWASWLEVTGYSSPPPWWFLAFEAKRSQVKQTRRVILSSHNNADLMSSVDISGHVEALRSASPKKSRTPL